MLSDVSASNGAHRATLAAALRDAWSYDVLVVWALDRICREGIEEMLRIVRELRERDASLISLGEPWLSTTDPMVAQVLLSLVAWIAEFESKRHAERVKAGLARRRAEGKPMGGAASRRGKDRKPRRTDGYRKAWKRRKNGRAVRGRGDTSWRPESRSRPALRVHALLARSASR